MEDTGFSLEMFFIALGLVFPAWLFHCNAPSRRAKKAPSLSPGLGRTPLSRPATLNVPAPAVQGRNPLVTTLSIFDSQEMKSPDLEVDVLVAMENVTGKVNAALKTASSLSPSPSAT